MKYWGAAANESRPVSFDMPFGQTQDEGCMAGRPHSLTLTTHSLTTHSPRPELGRAAAMSKDKPPPRPALTKSCRPDLVSAALPFPT